MGFLEKLFGKKAQVVVEPHDQSVIVDFALGSNDPTPIFELGDQLSAAIAAANVGEFDGNEIAADGSTGSLYMYGQNADRLFEVVRPILLERSFMRKASVRLRYGPPGPETPRKTITLDG